MIDVTLSICQKMSSCHLAILPVEIKTPLWPSKLQSVFSMFASCHASTSLSINSMWDSCSQVNLKRVNSVYRRAFYLKVTDKSHNTNERKGYTPRISQGCIYGKKKGRGDVDGWVPTYLSGVFQRSSSKNHPQWLLPQSRIELFRSNLSYSGCGAMKLTTCWALEQC